MARTDVAFPSGGERCAAWLYPGSGPCVVMAHGFALVKEARLDAYAERFAAAGMGVLVFDYRHFGASGGQPRELLDISRQLEDWRAAVAFARGIEGVDPGRIALWGTSFSGGHVVEVAAGDDRVAAVVSQVPFAGMARREGPPRIGFLARMVGSALLDEARGRLRLSPHYVPVVGPEDEFAAFNRPGAMAEMEALVPAAAPWKNRYTPRAALRIPRYRPFEAGARLGCPWLLCVADEDDVTPADVAVEAAAGARHLELRRYPGGHFSLYTGEPFEGAVAHQTEFLVRHLVADLPATFRQK